MMAPAATGRACTEPSSRRTRRRPDRVATALFALEQIGIKLGLEQIRALLARARATRIAPSVRSSSPARTARGRSPRWSSAACAPPAIAPAATPRRISSTIEERFADRRRADLAAALRPRPRSASADAAAPLPAPPSFFEATTALALEVFREAAVDVAVLEVGLGGRLDATNVVTPMAAAITAIDFDHEQYLGTHDRGDRRREGRRHQARLPVVLGAQSADVVRAVVRASPRSVGAPLTYAPGRRAGRRPIIATDVTRLDLRTPSGDVPDVPLGLRGRHQIDNAVTAVRLLEELDAHEPARASRSARHARRHSWTLAWPGTTASMRHMARIDVLIDGAHNPAGAPALAAYIGETYRAPRADGLRRDARQEDRAISARRSPASASAFVFTARARRRAPRRPTTLMVLAQSLAPGVPVHVAARPARGAGRARRRVGVAGRRRRIALSGGRDSRATVVKLGCHARFVTRGARTAPLVPRSLACFPRLCALRAGLRLRRTARRRTMLLSVQPAGATSARKPASPGTRAHVDGERATS